MYIPETPGVETKSTSNMEIADLELLRSNPTKQYTPYWGNVQHPHQKREWSIPWRRGLTQS